MANADDLENDQVDRGPDHQDLKPVTLTRTKSWKEYDVKNEIPYILSEGLLPVKFQASETVRL